MQHRMHRRREKPRNDLQRFFSFPRTAVGRSVSRGQNREESVRLPIRIGVCADDCSPRIRTECMASDRREKINSGVPAGVSQEAVEHASVVFEITDDIASRADIPMPE